LRDILRELDRLDLTSAERLLLGTAWKVMLFGFLRISEAFRRRRGNGRYSTPIRKEDVKFCKNPHTGERFVIVHLPPNKTDKSGKKFRIVLKRLDERNSDICPVRALEELWDAKEGDPENEPLFASTSLDIEFSYQRFSAILRACLKKAGYDDTKYRSHSFRIGAATVARGLGFSGDDIKILGRWKSEAWKVYSRPCIEHVGLLMANLQEWNERLAFA
jgi:hypothetical protein